MSSRPGRYLPGLYLPALLLLVLTVACCPVPTTGGGETAFAATVEAVGVEPRDTASVAGEFADARLVRGGSVRLALPTGTPTPNVGSSVWVEGTWDGEAVQVRLLRVIEQAASQPG